MKPLETHLTEDERHAFADDTLAREQRESVEAHLATCALCAGDVARITTLMKRIHEAPAPTAPLDELWPSIRARIEQTKLVPLDAGSGTQQAGNGHARWFASIGVVAAAVIGGIRPVGPTINDVREFVTKPLEPESNPNCSIL